MEQLLHMSKDRDQAHSLAADGNDAELDLIKHENEINC